MLTEPPTPLSSSHNNNSSSNSRASLYDYMREGWKDLEVELRLRSLDVQRGLDMTRGVVHQTYQGTGRAVKQTIRTVRNELGEEFGELKADFTVQKQLVQQDLQELLDVTRTWRSHVQKRHHQRQPQPPSPTQQAQPNNSSNDNVDHNQDNNSHHGQTIITSIRDFETKLADPLFVGELNTMIQSKLTSCSDLVEYYQQRPELRDFTLNKELSRMTYVLFTDQGQKLTEPEEILHYAMANPHQHEILWRAANQSIFGDVITSLTCETGLVRPQLCTASFVDDISVTIDFGRDAPHITAECFVNVSIPGWEGERLQLAGVLVGVYFCPAASKMEARVLHISASPPLTDNQIQGAAFNLSQR